MKAEFPVMDLRHYPRPQKGKQELLAKAIGVGKGIEQVLDLSCGLAQDAYFFAQLGLRVLALERNPTVFRWISQSITKARMENPTDVALSHLEIRQANAVDAIVLEEYQDWVGPSTAFYFDPMFPHKRKSALPRKEMQLFQKIVGADEDSLQVLQACLQTKAGRIIVKRPIKAPPLLDQVQHQFRGSSIRYDLYMTTTRKDEPPPKKT